MLIHGGPQAPPPPPPPDQLTLLLLTSSRLPSFTTNSPRMDSDDSTNTVLNTMSQLNNSVIDSPDEFQNSEPSPSTFHNPPDILSIPKIPIKPPQPLLPTQTQPQSSPQ